MSMLLRPPLCAADWRQLAAQHEVLAELLLVSRVACRAS
jgi:hypothetical protein